MITMTNRTNRWISSIAWAGMFAGGLLAPAHLLRPETAGHRSGWITYELPPPPPPLPDDQQPTYLRAIEETPAPVAAAPVVKVTLTAIRDSWVEVETDGQRTLGSLVRAEATLSFEGARSVRVLVGSASDVKFEFNGKPLDSVGVKGQVKVMEFDATGFRPVAGLGHA